MLYVKNLHKSYQVGATSYEVLKASVSALHKANSSLSWARPAPGKAPF